MGIRRILKSKTTRPLVFIFLAFLSAVLHNAIYGLFGIEEAVFFLLAIGLAITGLVLGILQIKH